MGLVEKSIEKIVDIILVSDEMSDFICAKDQLETLTNLKPTLREALLARAQEVGKTLPSLYLLAFAYSGEYTLDWAPFTGIDIAGLKSALEAGSFSSVTTINLSGTLASQSPSELPDALSDLPLLKTLILLERADRPDDSVASQLILSFASSSPSINLSRILLSGTMSLPIRQDLWLPDQTEPPQTVPGFPVTQLLVCHKTDGSRNQAAPYEYFFLGDALVGPGRFVNSFLRYLHLLNAERFRIDSGTGYPLAAYIATASSTLGSQEVGEIGPLPRQVYKFGKNGFYSNLCDSYYSDMRNLKPGQFTILVARNESEQENYDDSQYDKGFRYAFVRSKSEIFIRPEGDKLTKIDPATLEVFSLQEFIQETLPGTSTADLEPLFGQLRSQVANPDNQSPSNDDVLRCINTEEARGLLEEFIQNILKLDKIKQNRHNLKRKRLEGGNTRCSPCKDIKLG